MAPDVAAFGAALRRHRIAAGLTQEQLAERAGLSTRGIQDLERGARRSPHPETVRRLAEALGQAGDALERLEAAAPARANQGLPIALSSFVGRERDIREVAARLHQARLVTLSGTGGIGKSRLCLEVAAAVASEYADGIIRADLGALVDGKLVVACVAGALGMREQFLRPLSDTLCDALADQQLLLVLDNCDHVLADSVTLIDRLLRCSPDLRVLATSREPLRIDGESVWRVPPLRVPDPSRPLSQHTLLAHGATRLFLERARSQAPDVPLAEAAYRTIAEICRRLDGVPLAIELAAARTSILTLDQLAQRLDDAIVVLTNGSRTAPPRHQTLSATIDWSYRLLSEEEKVLLERLSVFAGGFTLEAAEGVTAGDGLEAREVFGQLGRLVDKSLVAAEPGEDGAIRYRLQEVLRQFGQERLAARAAGAPDEVDGLRTRHAAYFLHFVEDAEPRALGSDRKIWLDRLELELDNFRAAQRWLIQRGDAESAQRLCASLYRLLVYRGHAAEGRASLSGALALSGGSDATRGRALHFLGSLAWTQGDYSATHEYQQQALQLRRQIGDRNGLVWTLAALGINSTMRGDFEMAEALLAEARETGRAGEDRYVLGLSLSLSALTAYLQSRFDAARTHAREAMHVAIAGGFDSIRCMALTTLGSLSYLDDDLEASLTALVAALATAEALDEVFLIERASLNLALVAAEGGEMLRARSLLAESVALAQQLGNSHHVAQALEGVAGFAARGERRVAAARFAGAASEIRACIGAPISPTERLLLERRLGSLDDVPGAFDEGRTWSIQLATARALEFVEAYSGGVLAS